MSSIRGVVRCLHKKPVSRRDSLQHPAGCTNSALLYNSIAVAANTRPYSILLLGLLEFLILFALLCFSSFSGLSGNIRLSDLLGILFFSIIVLLLCMLPYTHHYVLLRFLYYYDDLISSAYLNSSICSLLYLYHLHPGFRIRNFGVYLCYLVYLIYQVFLYYYAYPVSYDYQYSASAGNFGFPGLFGLSAYSAFLVY